MVKREVTLKEFLSDVKRIDAENNMFISGVSGSGKDYVAELIRKLGIRTESLDNMATVVDDKWIVDVAKITYPVVFGTSDNLIEVYERLKTFKRKPVVVWIRPGATIFRAAMTAKVKDVSKKAAIFKPYWEKMSKFSDRKVEAYISERMENLIAKIKPDELLIVHNDSQKEEIVNGWHGVKPDETPPIYSAKDVKAKGIAWTAIQKRNDMIQQEEWSYKFLPMSLETAKVTYGWGKKFKSGDVTIRWKEFPVAWKYKESLINPTTSEIRVVFSTEKDGVWGVMKLMPNRNSKDTLLHPKLFSYKIWRGDLQSVKADWRTRQPLEYSPKMSEYWTKFTDFLANFK